MYKFLIVLVTFMTGIFMFSACSSAPPVKQQAYAKLRSERTFENEFPVVWKAIESAFRNFKITDRDPSEVNELEMRKLTERSLETDWVYSESRDKYQEYKVDGFPRKKYLQTRLRYTVKANAVMGGVKVTVAQEEEIERLKSDGTSAGYDSVDNLDSSRSNEIVEKISMAILSSAP